MIESLSTVIEKAEKELSEKSVTFWEKMEFSTKVDPPISLKKVEAIKDFWKGLETSIQDGLQAEKADIKNAKAENREQAQDGKHCPIDGHGGHWEGERGNGKWIPDKNYVPQKQNPEKDSWGEILDEYNIDGVPFKDGEPDFSEVSKGNVEIEDFSEDRSDNFDKADIELAKQRGCTPEEVAKWRKENGYTWHECKDMKTMQKVPSKVHNNISHSGGVSEAKKESGE